MATVTTNVEKSWLKLNGFKISLTSQLNSRSDSIVEILTLKVFACFLISELNPIFAAKALAMANSSKKLTIQLFKVASTLTYKLSARSSHFD